MKDLGNNHWTTILCNVFCGAVYLRFEYARCRTCVSALPPNKCNLMSFYRKYLGTRKVAGFEHVQPEILIRTLWVGALADRPSPQRETRKYVYGQVRKQGRRTTASCPMECISVETPCLLGYFSIWIRYVNNHMIISVPDPNAKVA